MLFLHDIYHIIGMEQDNLYNLLQSIDTPDDLRHLSADKLPEVCKELRQKIIDELSCNPGHFGSSLGVIELTVALHYVFNTPYDRIVWDVGHQAYGHKILTGRRDAFCTNRKLNGIRPFPSPSESEYDTFTCGHASNSISAALGMAVAAKKHGENNRHVVAVIGDGSMSGGLAFEGLNNASATPNNLLIILNDNNMAIDRSVGGMKQYLLNLQMSEGYNRIRYKISQMFHRWGILNEERRKSLIRFNNSLKSMLVQQQNVFEGMNIRYFGPIDGHDVNNLARVLKEIKDIDNIYRRQQITCNIVLDSNNLTDEFKRLYPGLLIDGDFTNEVFSYSENTLKEIEVDNLKDDEIILINSISRYNEDGKLEKIDITNYKEGDIIKIPAASLKYIKIMDMEECKKAINEDIKNNNYMEFKVKKIVDKDLFSNDYNCNFQLIINENKFNELFKDQHYNRDLGYRYPDINDNEQVEKIISKVNSVANEYGVAYIDFVKDNKVQEEMWTIINVFIYGFIIMVTLIVVVNVVNTITLNILLKKKEYGTLETIGMDIRQLNKMVILEGLLHGIISSIVGGVIAVILSKIAIRIVGYGFTLNDGLYLSPFIIGIIANLIIVLIASLIPLRKLKKMTLVETIKASE